VLKQLATFRVRGSREARHENVSWGCRFVGELDDFRQRYDNKFREGIERGERDFANI